MDTGSRGQELGIKDEVIKKACSASIRAHQAPEKPFLVEKIGRGSPSQVVFAFSGSWSFDQWSAGDGKARAFGETEVNLAMFPSLRSIGNDITATVNESFMRQFLQIVEKSALHAEVEKAMRKSKPIIFAGHSSGGPIAIYATVWLLEEYKRSRKTPTHGPFCLTFGSPLTTDRIFCHAVRREEWSDRFVHFVMLHDIVPRILLAPLSSTREFLEQILPCLISASTHRGADSIDKVKLTALFGTVMRNASCVASHAACILMGSTNMLLDTMTKFVELSPYRPCGKYVFCTGAGRSVVVRNPDAVFQLLFYSLQLMPASDVQQTAVASLLAHLAYEDGLDKSLDMRNAVHLENLRELPLSSDGTADIVTKTIDAALNGLNLSARARLCLRAAGESERQKEDNQTKVEHKMVTIEKYLSDVEGYRTSCETRGMGYFDAFKVQKYEDDFKANVKRLELAGIWDEIIEMLKRDELPDKFEAGETWVQLATRFRQLVEPLDIANYYRHLKNEDTGPYMTKGRPKRYKYTQRWREHAEQLQKGSCGQSCFWAEVEELNLAFANKQPLNERMALELAKKLREWHDKGEVKKDAFLKETAVARWWQTLPDNHEAKSCIGDLIAS
ncbi:protein EDS1L-like [Rhodamnia argentea]|uniref:Protein EDS1L-like n=1 Tax=Rhodamnia argentea TaxID=178133 RepID=A0A8B8NGA8_9MYRT|nr:protein EDS1L-like [Rhodamnia argentea]